MEKGSFLQKNEGNEMMQGDLNSRELFKISIVDFLPTVSPINYKNQAKRTFGSQKTDEGM